MEFSLFEQGRCTNFNKSKKLFELCKPTGE